LAGSSYQLSEVVLTQQATPDARGLVSLRLTANSLRPTADGFRPLDPWIT